VRLLHVAEKGVAALHDDLPAAREIEMPEPFHPMRELRRRCGGIHGHVL
jgi:hypothetical protein